MTVGGAVLVGDPASVGGPVSVGGFVSVVAGIVGSAAVFVVLSGGNDGAGSGVGGSSAGDGEGAVEGASVAGVVGDALSLGFCWTASCAAGTLATSGCSRFDSIINMAINPSGVMAARTTAATSHRDIPVAVGV